MGRNLSQKFNQDYHRKFPLSIQINTRIPVKKNVSTLGCWLKVEGFFWFRLGHAAYSVVKNLPKSGILKTNQNSWERDAAA